jgi:hypothetical protein
MTAHEEVLITKINYLSDRVLPPAIATVKILAAEIRGTPISKN